MDKSLAILAAQNEQLLAVLMDISSKLDVLSNLELHVADLSSEVTQIKDELQWHQNLSFASQLIKSVDNITEAVRDRL